MSTSSGIEWGVIDDQGWHRCVGGVQDAQSLAAVGHVAGVHARPVAVVAPETLAALLDVAEAARRRREMDDNLVRCRQDWDDKHDALAALALSNATVFAEAGERDLNWRLDALDGVIGSANPQIDPKDADK